MNQQRFLAGIWLCGLSAMVLSHCNIPFEPKLKSTDTNALVVEGFIDGSSPITFKLSRSRKLTAGDTASPIYELNARMAVEDDHQDAYPLTETGNGVYSIAASLSLNSGYQYRVHIFTANGEEYLSDFVAFKTSPAIDSVGWAFQNGGVQVLVNTHDPANNTRYYRWSYSETWEFNSAFYSSYQYDASNNTLIPRLVQINTCWQSDIASLIFLSSSANLSSDVISQKPLVFIPQHDPKLSILYSIQVTQYAMDVTAYNYWLAMANNTQNIGSIFDPQPNETPGNIHCVTHPAELVVGYISAGNSSVTRTFISNSSMPSGWNLPSSCFTNLVPNNPDSIKYYFGGTYDPVMQVIMPGGAIFYSASSIPCVDCTLKGTNVKPSFWP